MRLCLSIIFFLLFAFSFGFSQDLTIAENEYIFRPYTILSPLPDSIASYGEPLEISLLLDGMAGLDIKLLLDSIDITNQAQITTDYLFYLSKEPAKSGKHSICLLFLNQKDTVFSDTWSFEVSLKDTSAELLKIPWDFSITAGGMYSECNRDTSGLGLVYPVGWKPSGDIYASGLLAQGFVNSYLSFDPSYDKYLHGLMQYDRQNFGLSLGEFFPEMSSLVFSATTPVGILASYKNNILGFQGTACRTQPADTLFMTYAQYLYGGQSKLRIVDSFSVTAGYLYGYDQPGSLPDSVRLKSSVYIYDDTLTGFSDTLITVDTLLSGQNHLGWLAMEWPIKKSKFRIEYALSGFRPNSSDTYKKDRTFSLGLRSSHFKHSVDLQFISWGQYFKSFGNPYLEAAKNEMLWKIDSKWSKHTSSRFDGSMYKVFTDSSLGNSLKLGGGLYFSSKQLSSSSIRLDYNLRPYISYLYQNRSLSLVSTEKLGPYSLLSSYSFSSSSGFIATRSHSVMLGVAGNFADEKLHLQLSGYYYQADDDKSTINQSKTTAELRAIWQYSNHFSIITDIKNISLKNYIDAAKSYTQHLVSLMVSYHF
jgi:hypothetical protein